MKQRWAPKQQSVMREREEKQRWAPKQQSVIERKRREARVGTKTTVCY